MKLYANTKSERASKGQGGNQYLIIDITAEGLEGIPTRANLYRVNIVNDNGKLYADILNYRTHETIVLSKGNQQKGEG